MILIIIALLLIKHWVVDFPLQNHAMINNKGTYGHIAGITHAFYHWFGTFLVFLYFSPNDIQGLGIAILVSSLDGLIHYHVDWSKAQINDHFKLTVKDDRFWHLIGLDQLVHGLTYVGLIYVWLLLTT